MEKLTIKPWQVMQAHENGADVECTNKNDDYHWVEPGGVVWNFPEVKYRIANLTADGMRLDELIEKFPDKIELLFDLSVKNELLMFSKSRCDTDMLIKFLLLYPDCISQVKVKQEKKLRPWTMEEFEKHRDEWFLSKSGSKRKVIHFSNNTLLPAWYGASVTYKEFMESFNREDGSPCGVLE